MRFVYSQWDDALAARLQALKNLMAVFNHILLQVNGNVDTALKVMEKLKEMGYLPPDTNLEEFKKQLQEQKFVTVTSSGNKLTTKGERNLRRDAFDKIFEQLRLSGDGHHLLPHEGGSSDEIQPERRSYRFGDDLRHIDFRTSLLNSVTRSGSNSFDLREDDLEVFDTDMSTNCATALLIDISHSMILYGEDRITPAKQVALAFTELILTRFPKDTLHVVLFGDYAVEIPIKDLPYIGVGPYHTNTKAGLQMARRILLRQKCANRQIFMITDGKPSMITRRNGSVFRNPFGLDPVVVNRTLDEAIICRKKRIPITTFMIAEDPYLRQFVEKLTELNKGRAYFASPEDLGDYVFWDFLKHRRKAG
jgi:Ca-activated chloride channel family protein